MLAFTYQTISGLRIALRRLLAQPLLSLAALVGLILAAGLLLSVPLYADATHFRLLREELLSGRSAELLSRPPDYAPLSLVFEFSAAGAARPDGSRPQWIDGESLDRYLSLDAENEIDLSLDDSVTGGQASRRFLSDSFRLYPVFDPNLPGSQYALEWVNLALLTPLEELVDIIGGTSFSAAGGEELEVLVSETLATNFGLQVGETYHVRRDDLNLEVRIAGIWRPKDPTSPVWEVRSEIWFLVSEQAYREVLSPKINDDLWGSQWSLTFDGGNLHSGDVAGLLQRIHNVEQRAALLLPGTKLSLSPLAALERYQENAPRLTYLLLAFSVPILGLIFAFISLVTGLLLDQQRGEIAILRSRGAGKLQIGWIALLQGLILGGAAIACGLPLGMILAGATGHARSFLDFSAPGELRLQYTPAILLYGVLGIGALLLLLMVLPAVGAAEQTIIGYKQERARSLRQPFWQRIWLDLILLLPAAYGIWYLNRLASAAVVTGEGLPGAQAASDGLQTAASALNNPLLLLVPALGLFAAALLALRVVPRLMSLAATVLAQAPGVELLMAARYLARSPAFYGAPLVLLVLTLSLSAFTASLAQTLDSQLRGQMYYEVGADLRLLESGTHSNEDKVSGGWFFRPIEEHLSLPGVLGATQVGRYTADVMLPGGRVEATFLGIDRLTFPQVAFWQAGGMFANQELGGLMNALAADPEGVLLPRSLMLENGLQVGNELTLAVRAGVIGESQALTLRIVGDFELFPTWYPQDGPLVVADLNNLFLMAGSEFPHEVWLRTDPQTDIDQIVYGVRGYTIMLDMKADQSRLVENGLNTFVTEWASAPLKITDAQSRPERQGLFGILSVGFISSALLTALGFLLYALFSFRRRLIELGMLRAIGLSALQMSGLLAAELAFLVLLGVGLGTVLGLSASQSFVPYLQMGSSTQAQYPPFQIVIAWSAIFQMYALFGLLFLAALSALVGLLLRMKIFQAIKLGETT